jgi:hypothetical protein
MQSVAEYVLGRTRWRARVLAHRLRRRLGRLPKPSPEDRELVFAVGMHRTGTRSLSLYLEELGFRSLHWPWWCEADLRKNLDSDDRIMEVLEPLFYQYDCFSDVPFPGLYKILDQRFPRSRFILTCRDPEGWWQSVVKHWGLETKGRLTLDPGEFIQYKLYEPFDKAVITMDDRDLQIAKFERHNREVRRHFAARKEQLLVLDLKDAEINRKISEFLGKQTKPYPHVGRKNTAQQ